MQIKSILIDLLIALTIVNIVGSIVPLTLGGNSMLLNYQAGFLCTFLVVSATFVSYLKNYQLNKDEAEFYDDDRDELDKIDDKHELFEEDENQKEMPQEEKKQKKFSWKKLLLGSQLFFSIYRVIAYGVLGVTVLGLMSRQIFDVFGFLLGVTLFSLATIGFMIMRQRRK